MRVLTLIAVCITLSSCGLAVRTLEFLSPTFETMQEEARRDSGDEKTIQEFQNLLNDGWELFLYEGNKIVLIKDTPDGRLIKDVFGVLND